MHKLIFVVLFIAAATAHFFEGFKQDSNAKFTSNNFKSLGSACGTNTTCGNFNQCDFGYCNTTLNMCLIPQTLQLGATCNDNDICTGGTCLFNGSSTGICTVIKQYLCPCDFTLTDGNIQLDPTCDTGLCFQGKCDSLKVAGAACTQSYECASNTCLSNSCTSNKNLGDNCTCSSTYCDACPIGSYCSSVSVCTQYAALGANCTQNKCGSGSYCDITSKTCKVTSTLTAGQACQSSNECVYSSNCNGGTCVAIQDGSPCTNSNCTGLCTCNGGQTSCQYTIGTSCDSAVTTLISCETSNCYTQPINLDGNGCLIKNCRSQAVAAYCCISSSPKSASQAFLNNILPYFDCSKNKFIGSGCDPNSTSLVTASFATLFVALLFVLANL